MQFLCKTKEKCHFFNIFISKMFVDSIFIFIFATEIIKSIGLE